MFNTTSFSNAPINWLLDNAIRYQFNAHLTNDQVVNNILVKALTTLPEPDFNLCLYLLNEQMVTEEPVVRLIALQDLIEQARFADFWKLYEGDDIYKELTAEVLGFEDSIRASTFILDYFYYFQRGTILIVWPLSSEENQFLIWRVFVWLF